MTSRYGGALGRRGRCWLGMFLAGWLWSATNRCMADDAGSPLRLVAPALEAGTQTYAYVKPARAQPLRAGLEVAGLLGLGLAQYFANASANSTDWEFGYDWDSFRTRLSGSGYSLDTNKFDTNFMTHPGSGTLYYWAARSNRLSVVASFAYAALASTLWEFFGELRERVSINDMLVTPTAGLVLGETTFQLGAFFDRSCPGTLNAALGTVLGPAKSLHDAIDGAQPLRDSVCDRYGFSLRGEHEFRIALGAASVWPLHGSSHAPVAEAQLALHTRIVALDAYGTAGEGVVTFADGNLSELWLEGAFGAGQWTQFALGSRIVPIGLLYRSFAGADTGRGLFGHELLFGLLLGTEYSLHRYDRHGSGDPDRIFTLDVPGVELGYRRHVGHVRWELELQASATFAGIDAFALPLYLEHAARDALPSVAREQGYNYAAGVSLRPRARLSTDYVELGAELWALRVWGINNFDRRPELQSPIADAELRRKLRVWASFGRRTWPLRPTLAGVALQRWGQLGELEANRAELQLGASLDAVF